MTRGTADTRTIPAAFEGVAEWRPDNEAFVQALGGDDRRYTYAEADRTITRFADGLRGMGVGEGDRVAILSRTTVEHALTFYACAKVGAISATLHAREAPNVVSDMVRRVGAETLVFQPRFAEEAERFAAAVDSLDRLIGYDGLGDLPDPAIGFSEVVERGDPDAPGAPVSPDDTAFVNFSSGTTGTPKGIVHTHEHAVEASHLGGGYFLRPTDGTVSLNAFTPSFIAWPNTTLPVTNVGGSTVFLEEWRPERLPAVIEREGIDLAVLVPTQWRKLLQADVEAGDLSSLERVGYAGEPMGEALFSELTERITQDVFSAYGSTETMTSGTALLPHEVGPETIDSIGRPMPNVDVRIVEPDTGDPEARVERGERGELIVRAPTVAEEVWDDPEKTAEIFHEDGWWFSGDLAYASEAGYVYLEGRVDNMIISGGINIYAEGVERLVENHPDVIECAIVPIPHDEWGQTVKAYVVASGDLSADDLDEWCRENDDLGNYQRPRAYEFVSDLPRTNTGKLDRAALRGE